MKDYVYRDGLLVASRQKLPGNPTPVTWHYHLDHLGTPRRITTDSDAVIGSHTYYAFGPETQDGLNEPSLTRMKFTGHERDLEASGGLVELDYMHARYYSAALGRFLSVDPVLDLERVMTAPQLWNRYAYALNNPMVFTDPTGETVYLVTYTTGNRHGDDEFKRAAETRAAEIAKQKGFDTTKDKVLLVGVRTKEDFAAAIKQANGLKKQFGKVGDVTLFSHSGPLDGPIFHDAAGHMTQFESSEVASLNVNWEAAATASFYGCNTAGFAQTFANKQGVPTYGFSWYSSFSSNPNHYERIRPTGPVYMMSVAPRRLRNLGLTTPWPMSRADPYTYWIK